MLNHCTSRLAVPEHLITSLEAKAFSLQAEDPCPVITLVLFFETSESLNLILIKEMDGLPKGKLMYLKVLLTHVQLEVTRVFAPHMLPSSLAIMCRPKIDQRRPDTTKY